MSSAGRFVWYDLMTSDVAAARAFYSDIIGWKSKPFSGGNYELWSAPDTDVGGLMALSDEQRAGGAPPFWIGYVETDEVDATARRVTELGGRVHVPPTGIPDVGRFAMVADPQGAAFALFQSQERGAAPGPTGVGHFSWAELNTTDWQSAWKFYSALFGWKKVSSMDMGPEYGEYFMFGTDPEQMMGGMSNAAPTMKAPPHWLHYINVASVDETAKRIPGRGGKILNGPMDVPGGDRIAQCQDPQGGMFAIYSTARK